MLWNHKISLIRFWKEIKARYPRLKHFYLRQGYNHNKNLRDIMSDSAKSIALPLLPENFGLFWTANCNVYIVSVRRDHKVSMQWFIKFCLDLVWELVLAK